MKDKHNNPYACWLNESVPVSILTKEQLDSKYRKYKLKSKFIDQLHIHTFSFDMDNHLQQIQRKKSDFLNEVDQAIKDYFMFKYNTDLNEIERIKNNVNNFKLNSRFQKVVQLSSGQESYYDGEFLFLTAVNHPLKENLIIRHGWDKEEK